jgi:hypothetical protein
MFCFVNQNIEKQVKYSAEEHGESIMPAWTKTLPTITSPFMKIQLRLIASQRLYATVNIIDIKKK